MGVPGFLNRSSRTARLGYANDRQARLAQLPKIVPTHAEAQNGTGAFVLPCTKVELSYCDKWASNAGLREFIVTRLAEKARAYPMVEFVVKQRPHHHPTLTAKYAQGSDKVYNLRKHAPQRVESVLDWVLNSSGVPRGTIRGAGVSSKNENPRGMWSAFHEDPDVLRRRMASLLSRYDR